MPTFGRPTIPTEKDINLFYNRNIYNIPMSEQGGGRLKEPAQEAIADLADYIDRILPPEAPRFRSARRRWRDLREYYIANDGEDSIFSLLPKDVGSRDTRPLTGALLNLFRESWGSEKMSRLVEIPNGELKVVRGIGSKSFPLVKKIKVAAIIVLSQRKANEKINT